MAHLATAASYGGLGANLSFQGKYAEAQPLLETSADLCRDLLGQKSFKTANSYNSLAANLHAQKKFAEAESLHSKVLALNRELLGEKHRQTAASYNNLAVNLNSQERFDEAELLGLKALEIRRELLGERHPDTANSYLTLGGILSAQRKYGDAQLHLEKAVQMNRELFGEKHANTARSCNVAAVSLGAQGKWADARPVLTQAVAAYEAARLTTAGRGRDRGVFGGKMSPYQLLAATEANLRSPIAAWMANETDLARGLGDEIAFRQGHQLSAEAHARQTAINSRLNQLQPRLLVLISKSRLTDSERTELELGQIERRKLENELAELAVALSQRDLTSLPNVQRALPSTAALLFWVDLMGPGVSEHWGCVVRSTGEPEWERLPGTGTEGQWTKEDTGLISKARDVLRAAAVSTAELDDLARKLQTQRLAPLTKHLNDIQTLYIIPAYEMACIPVEVITSDYTISYVPSGTFVAKLAVNAPDVENRLLAVGDPLFTPSSGWKELPGTRIELAQIARLFGLQAKVLVGSTASEQAVDNLRRNDDLEKFPYLHFATHGETIDTRAFESSLILSQDTLPKDALPMVGGPYIDGKISASEVLEYWKLDAKLVTLSACETALGRKGGGDGMLGFAQAFLTAGARSVCLSLWKVDDRATALLMTRFYQNLLGKRPGLDKPMPKAEALAEAKMWLRNLTLQEVEQLMADAKKSVIPGSRAKEEDLNPVVSAADPKQPLAKDGKEKPFAHPRFWAAFILIGDPN